MNDNISIIIDKQMINVIILMNGMNMNELIDIDDKYEYIMN